MGGLGDATVVRRLTGADWRLLREVRLTALAEAPLAFGSTLAREQAFTDEVWRARCTDGVRFVAQAGASALGMAAGFHEDDTPRTEQHLVAMWVAPAFRGRGIAALLVRAVADWASAEAGATVLSLCVAEGNDVAQRLYERLGFTETGRVEPLPTDPSRVQRHLARPLPW